jgi:amino acid adenylation domain-containing protein
LERRSNQLARLLLEGGCKPGDRVGLLLPKSAVAVTAMLGVLKAGGLYVPVDPESPAARIEKILNAAEYRYICAGSAATALLNGLLPAMAAEMRPGLIWMDEAPPDDLDTPPRFIQTDAAALNDEPLPSALQPGAGPAHLLFTSGSTGQPKGVIVTHANVIAFVDWAHAYFDLNDGDRVSCHSPLHFDLSTFDLYGAFSAGAEVHLVPAKLNLFPKGLIGFMRDRRLTQWFSVPSVLTYLTRFDAVAEGDFPEMKRLIWCGEVFPTPSLIYWMEKLPHVAFTNLYGPTEATIASSYYTVPSAPSDPHESVPIGKACGGEEMLILGDDLKPLAKGETGDIHIAGAGVTDGYWRDQAKTEAAFRPYVGASAAAGERMYRTGDLGYVGDDDQIHFVGRADSQIKSRGHRIELGEIETALNSLAEVGQVVVVAIEVEFGSYNICCAFAPADDHDPSPQEIKRRLASLVPRYMLPVSWKKMTTMPSNANGKDDRVALTAM